MTVKEIKVIAKSLGIAPGRKKKSELILAIQEAEHNIPCFGKKTICQEVNCLWRKDCCCTEYQ